MNIKTCILCQQSAKTLVWKQDDVKLGRHKQRTPNTNDYPMPLNEPPPMKIFCVRHCQRLTRFLFSRQYFQAYDGLVIK